MEKIVKERWKAIGLIIAVGLMTISLAGCEKGTDTNTVYLASAGPADRIEGEFKNGVTMAIDEINQADYLNGKQIKVDYFDDKRDLTTGIRIAQELAKQKDKYSAVIGHWNASISIPAATIYNDTGLLAITPMVSSPKLTNPAKEYIFRTVPTDADEAQKIAAYAAEKGYMNIAVCYNDSDYGTGLCNEFEKACGELGVNIIDSHVNFINQQEFDEQYDKWTALDIQAVFIADSLPNAVDLINLVRGKSQSLPILSAGGFSFDDVVSLAGTNSSNIAYVALYYPDQQMDSLKTFNQKYKERYGKEPASFLAAKGYECVYLIANGIRETGSKSSSDIAKYLHTMKPWQGVFDTYNFKENGDPNGMTLFVVEVNNGKYTYLQ